MILSVTFEKAIQPPALQVRGGLPRGGVIGQAPRSTISEDRDERDRHARRAPPPGTRPHGVPGLRLIGLARGRGAFSRLEGVHPHDIGTILDQEGIAIRTGHHCAQPVMDRFNVPATARASLGLYNTTAELDALAAGLRKVAEVFRA